MSLLVPPRRVMDRKFLAWIVYAVALVLYLVYIITLITTAVAARDDPPTSSKFKREIPMKMPKMFVCHFDDNVASAGYDEAPACSVNQQANSCTVQQSVEINLDFETEDSSGAQKKTCFVLNSDGAAEFKKVNDYLEMGVTWNQPGGSNINAIDHAVIFGFYEGDTPVAKDLFVASTGLLNQISISKQTYKELGGSEEVTYLATVVTAIDDVAGSVSITNGDGEDEEMRQLVVSPMYLGLRLRVESFLRLDVEEVDPVNANTLLGAIGGAWVYVGLIFALFFAKNPNTGAFWFRLNPSKDSWKAVLQAAYKGTEGDIEGGMEELKDVKKNEGEKSERVKAN